MLKIAVIGLGSRGKNYGTHFAKRDDVQIVAICDKYQAKIDKVKTLWKVPDNMCFTDEEDFFALGKVADCMLIATQDRDHYGHAMKALKLGYDLLIEKPLSPNIEECLEIEEYARAHGRKVLVCHVLRYAGYYRRIKEMIDTGVLGEIQLIKHDENISYWHFCHSYVRGNWRSEQETSPMLLAKCCHDMDLMYWFTGSKCKSLNSYGGLTFFNKDHKPEGATANCFDCPHRMTCNFEVEHQYLGRKKAIGRGKKKFLWGTYAFCTSSKKKDVLNALKTDERAKQWARCVFACDNDVVDCQTVNMEMENGVKVVMTANAFNEQDHRHTEIRGSKGVLIADDRGSVIILKLFGKKQKKVVVNIIPVIKGHYGGDQGIVKATVGMMTGNSDPNMQYTWIADTIESHRIVTAAELSRHEGGRQVLMSEIPDIKSKRV
ncbi:MAG: Gfo/Idh/MocA family oxidoreductase [Clostridia bacterium]|nr:Gfo/Idh/MocA family oxidoreductase [Clostridia bacterium]